MDIFGPDTRLCEVGDGDMSEFFDNDIFNSTCALVPPGDQYMDPDWLTSLFDDPVLNDKMITEAAQPPRIQSEHSYSINNGENESTCNMEDFAQDCKEEILRLPNNADPQDVLDLRVGHTTTTMTAIPTHSPNYPTTIKQEPMDVPDEIDDVICTTPFLSAHTQKQMTIYLTAPSSAIGNANVMVATHRQEHAYLPNNEIKIEPVDSFDQTSNHSSVDSVLLPPTPPSSAGSDSDGSSSPPRSAPSSPVRSCLVSRAMSKFSQPIFLNPIPTCGVLMLTEEEKRTLVTEGYTVPAKLPLTKVEEKNLKKIRRKIKNKISAQESRRKKKEYLEELEKRVDVFSHENVDLKKKVDHLETNNRSLISQLQKLQSLVGKMTRPGTTTQTGTVLMVLVLCFATFIGTWSPTSLNIGYSAPSPVSLYSHPQTSHPSPHMGPQLKHVRVDAYSTPNMKSRVLLSLKDECWDEHYAGPVIPSGNDATLKQPAHGDGNADHSESVGDHSVVLPDTQLHGRVSGAVETDTAVTTVMVTVNTSDVHAHDYQAVAYPDVPGDIVMGGYHGNATLGHETSV